MHWIKNAEYKKDYELVVEFEDGNIKNADLEKHLNKGLLADLKNVKKFKKFRVNFDTDTIEWENGADISPDFLYEIGRSIGHSSTAA